MIPLLEKKHNNRQQNKAMTALGQQYNIPFDAISRITKFVRIRLFDYALSYQKCIEHRNNIQENRQLND